jgi:LysM repeat protein
MMKMPKLPKLTKRLQVTARTLSETGSPDFAPAQPTARLGSAFVLVFSCHMLLIAGMFSFHKIRAGRIPAETVASAKGEKSVGEKPSDKTSTPSGAEAPKVGVQGSNGEAAAAAARAALAVGVGGAAVAAVGNGVSQPAAVPAKTAAVSSAGTPGAAKVETPAKPETAEVKASTRTYVVKSGDNPVRIAKTLSVKLEDLQALNGIDDPKKLKVGQTLKVPESAKVDRPAVSQTPTASASTSKTANAPSKNSSGSTKSAKSSLAASKNGTKGTSAASKK